MKIPIIIVAIILLIKFDHSLKRKICKSSH